MSGRSAATEQADRHARAPRWPAAASRPTVAPVGLGSGASAVHRQHAAAEHHGPDDDHAEQPGRAQGQDELGDDRRARLRARVHPLDAHEPAQRTRQEPQAAGATMAAAPASRTASHVRRDGPCHSSATR